MDHFADSGRNKNVAGENQHFFSRHRFSPTKSFQAPVLTHICLGFVYIDAMFVMIRAVDIAHCNHLHPILVS